MRTPCERPFSRRRFLGGLTLAGTASLLGLCPTPVVAEPLPGGGLRWGGQAFWVPGVAQVGLAPHGDVDVVVKPPMQAMQLLTAQQIDAFVGFPPEPQALRAKHIGHVLVNSTLDRPWSYYF